MSTNSKEKLLKNVKNSSDANENDSKIMVKKELKDEEEKYLKSEKKDVEEESEVEKIDCDSYLCLSVTMPELYIMLISPFILLKMGWKSIQEYYDKFRRERHTTMVLMFIFSPLIAIIGVLLALLILCFLIFLVLILMLPGLTTPIIQLFFFNFVVSNVEDEFDPSNVSEVFGLKVVTLFVLLFMVTNESTQSLNCIMICHSNAINKKLFFLFGCFIPQIIQILMTFILFSVSIYLIASSDTAIDLIQNFAGLYILLDLDVTIMQFLRTIKFTTLLIRIKKISQNLLKSELEGKKVFKLSFMTEAFEKSEIEFDLIEEGKKNPKFKKYQLGMRFCTIFLLMITGALVWFYVSNL